MLRIFYTIIATLLGLFALGHLAPEGMWLFLFLLYASAVIQTATIIVSINHDKDPS